MKTAPGLRLTLLHPPPPTKLHLSAAACYSLPAQRCNTKSMRLLLFTGTLQLVAVVCWELHLNSYCIDEACRDWVCYDKWIHTRCGSALLSKLLLLTLKLSSGAPVFPWGPDMYISLIAASESLPKVVCFFLILWRICYFYCCNQTDPPDSFSRINENDHLKSIMFSTNCKHLYMLCG